MANDLLREFLYGIYLRLEMGEHFGIHFPLVDVFQMASGTLDAHFFSILFHNEVCHCYEVGISTRVKNKDTIAIDIGNFAIGLAVVVTTKDEIETRNLLCHLQRGVLVLCACGVFATHTTVEVFPSLQAALNACQPDEDVYIIGGASVYAEAFPLAQRLCLTEVQAVPAETDVFFPEFDATQWQEISREHHDADERNAVPFDFVDYVRKDK